MTTLYVYLGIIAIGAITVFVLLIKENKGSKHSAIDLLNNLEIDEDPEETKKILPRPPQRSAFVDPAQSNLVRSAKEFEEKVRKPEPPKQNPSSAADIDKSTNDNKPSSQQNQ